VVTWRYLSLLLQDQLPERGWKVPLYWDVQSGGPSGGLVTLCFGDHRTVIWWHVCMYIYIFCNDVWALSGGHRRLVFLFIVGTSWWTRVPFVRLDILPLWPAMVTSFADLVTVLSNWSEAINARLMDHGLHWSSSCLLRSSRIGYMRFVMYRYMFQGIWDLAYRRLQH
jgi:hypothetical protein